MRARWVVMAVLLAATLPSSAEITISAVVSVTPQTWPERAKAINAGDTVEFADGFYGRLEIRKANTTWRAKNRWKARFAAVDVSVGQEAIAVYADHVTLQGLTVGPSQYHGVSFTPAAAFLAVRECWIAGNRLCGILGTGDDITVERCVIDDNGMHSQLCHGVYTAGMRQKFIGNIVRGNKANGFSEGPMVRDFEFRDNLVYDNGGVGILFFVSVGGAREHTKVTGNTCVLNRRGQVVVWCYARDSSQPSALISNNLLLGPAPYEARKSEFAPVAANVTVAGDNVMASDDRWRADPKTAWFIDASKFDYRTRESIDAGRLGTAPCPAWGKGFPQKYWWTDMSDWPNGYPFCRDPQVGLPQSLVP